MNDAELHPYQHLAYWSPLSWARWLYGYLLRPLPASAADMRSDEAQCRLQRTAHLVSRSLTVLPLLIPLTSAATGRVPLTLTVFTPSLYAYCVLGFVGLWGLLLLLIPFERHFRQGWSAASFGWLGFVDLGAYLLIALSVTLLLWGTVGGGIGVLLVVLCVAVLGRSLAFTGLVTGILGLVSATAGGC
jgi:hypothetical protein